MRIDVVMPKMGESITDGTILEWRKSVGEHIEKDEILLEIGTDKVDSEIPSATDGIVVELLAKPNDVVDVGVVIARIDTDGDSSVETKPATEGMVKAEILKTEKNDLAKFHIVETNAADKVDNLPKRKETFVTPVVRAIALKEGIDESEFATIYGSGHGGRVTKQDILKYVDQGKIKPKSTPAVIERPSSRDVGLREDRVEMDHIRKLIAEHMRKSIDTSAHVYVMTEVDMTRIVNFVNREGKSFKELEGFPLTYTPFIIQALTRSLKSFPEMNSSLDGTTIVHHKNINMGMAVALDGGLMVPVIPKCEELNFLGLCRKVRDVAVRTRNKQISPDELQGSTFSITNFGVFNVTVGTPIINQPNVGILGVGTIKKKPVVIETPQGDTIGIRSIMMISLGFDHRLIDGAGGSRFIESVQTNLEHMDLDNLF